MSCTEVIGRACFSPKIIVSARACFTTSLQKVLHPDIDPDPFDQTTSDRPAHRGCGAYIVPCSNSVSSYQSSACQPCPVQGRRGIVHACVPISRGSSHAATAHLNFLNAACVSHRLPGSVSSARSTSSFACPIRERQNRGPSLSFWVDILNWNPFGSCRADEDPGLGSSQ